MKIISVPISKAGTLDVVPVRVIAIALGNVLTVTPVIV